MIGMVDLSGKGSKIKGIVEEYVAKGNVSAGGFVKYANSFCSGNDIQLDNNINSGKVVSAVLLSENRVFVAHSNSDDMYLHATICTITKNTIIVGTDIRLSTTQNSGNYISIVKLNENKVFIAHDIASADSNNLYGMICTISNNTITVETDIKLNNEKVYNVSAVALSETKVFIVCCTSDNKLIGMVCTISGNTITLAGYSHINDTMYSGMYISTIKLSENTVFIKHGYSSSYCLSGIVCTISGTTITVGTDTQLSSISSTSKYSAIIALSANKIFIVYGYYNSGSGTLKGMICTINGTSITVATDIKLGEIKLNEIAITKLAENKLCIIVGAANTCLLTVNINETVITAEELEQIDLKIGSLNTLLAIALNSNRVFFIHSNNTNDYYFYGFIVDYSNISVQTATQADKIYRHSTSESIRRTSRQGRTTKLYYRGGKLKCIF